MSDLGVKPAAGVAPGLSQMQRLTNTFAAPSKTFEDIKRGNQSWWLPFLVGLVFSYIFIATMTVKVGWHQMAENVLNSSPKAQERMSGLNAEQRENTVQMTAKFVQYPTLAAPVLGLGFTALLALILWGTINFGFGGRATFGKVFAVLMYGTLPMIVAPILATIVLFTGLVPPESYNVENPAPVSVGAFLSVQDVGPVLYSLASRLDFTVIWSMILIGIGLATVAGIKRSSGYIAVFGWWSLMVIVRMAWNAFFG
jgi:hypothetical protein